MKTIKTLLLSSVIVLTSACAAHSDSIDSQGIIISKTELMAQSPEFLNNYQNYATEQQQVDALKAIRTPIKIVTLFGTWCHDSEREVPRMIKLIEQANNPNITHQLIAVNQKKQAAEHYQLQYTPTFIIYKNEQEVGRIVERPVTTLAQDIVNAL